MIKEFNPSTMLRINGEQGRTINLPKTIYLYDEGIGGLDFKQIKLFLKKNFGDIKVCLIRLKNRLVRTHGLLFDFIATKKAFDAVKYSKTKDSCYIILTDKLFATLDIDRRPHIRAGIYSFPSIISSSGIVEGPAKPKEYYLYKQRYTQLGIWERQEAKLKRKFKASFIDYADKRINEVLKGYFAQSLFFYITGEPFCKKKSCRLYNAHWQKDLIYAQVKIGRFCKYHQRLLKKIKLKPCTGNLMVAKEKGAQDERKSGKGPG